MTGWQTENCQISWLFVCFLELSPKERIKMMMFAFDMKFNQSAKFAWKLMRWLRSVLWWNLQRVHQPLVCVFSRWWKGVTTDFYSKVRTAMMIKTCGFHVFTNIFGMKCPFSALHCVPQELHSQDFLGGKLLYYCDFACADHGGTTRSEKTEFAQQPLVVVTWTVQRVHQTAVEDPALHLAWGCLEVELSEKMLSSHLGVLSWIFWICFFQKQPFSYFNTVTFVAMRDRFFRS